MGLILSGAMAGGGAALQQAGMQLSRQWGAEELEKMREDAATARQNALIEAQKLMETGRQAHDVTMLGKREDVRRAGRLADIEQDTNPDIIAKKGAAASGLIRATLPAKVEEKTALGQAETKLELERFEKLAPVKRQSAIDDALAALAARSTPEALKQARAIKQAEHIVDPSYTLIPNADGTVTTFDTKSGKSGGQLKDANGEPIIRKDSEELKAATAVINMAATNLKIAQAEHKATMADIGATPAEKAAATAAWESAQAEARRVSAPAYAVLYSKAKVGDTGETPAKEFPQPTEAHIAAYRTKLNDPRAVAAFTAQFGPDNAARYSNPGRASTYEPGRLAETPVESAESSGGYGEEYERRGIIGVGVKGIKDYVKGQREEKRKLRENKAGDWR